MDFEIRAKFMSKDYHPSLLLAKINNCSRLNLIADYLAIRELKSKVIECITAPDCFQSEFHFYFQLPQCNPMVYITIKPVI
jgi:hypothetical protein